jgi:uncharacterized membrane protein YciS (DUF1049 family)
MESWTLLAQSEVSQGAWIATLLLAAGGFITAVVTALNARREKLSATKIAEEKERSATRLAEEAARVTKERAELDWLFARNKELYKEAGERIAKVETELRETINKHIACEVRLARSEENNERTQDSLVRAEKRIALLETRLADRDQHTGA